MTGWVVKKDNKYLMDAGSNDTDNYSADIYNAEIIKTEEEALDVVAAGEIEGIVGEIAVEVNIDLILGG